MIDFYNYLAIICYIMSGVFLVTSLAMFFGFSIPKIWKNTSGELGKKQIEDMKKDKYAKDEYNVFEELEKKAKPRKSGTQNIKIKTSTYGSNETVSSDNTTFLQQSSKIINPNFIIEKNIVFVSTNEMA